jgi:hypothetical protein
MDRKAQKRDDHTKSLVYEIWRVRRCMRQGSLSFFFLNTEEEEQRRRMIWRHVSQGRLLRGSFIVYAAGGTLLKNTHKPAHTAFISMIILLIL